jgi:phage antirepressor YoqD-like protein
MKGLILNAQPAITSREIARLVGLRHDNVKRTIETLVGQGVVACPQAEEKPTAGRPVVEYVFSGGQGKRDSIIVVAQLSPAFTARLVDRWQELEANVAQPDPMVILTDPAAMRGLLLTYTEKVISLEQTVAEQAPQVATLHRIAAADGSLCMRDAAKVLQVRPVDLRRWLVAQGWVYQRPGHSGWLAYQDRIQQGVMCHKVTTVQREDGTDKVVEQARITPKGIARIGAELAKAAA